MLAEGGYSTGWERSLSLVEKSRKGTVENSTKKHLAEYQEKCPERSAALRAARLSRAVGEDPVTETFSTR